MMKAFDAGALLSKLARPGDVELAPSESAILVELVREGLVARAPDVRQETAELERVRAELAELDARTTPRTPREESLEQTLRARALELVERVSQGGGAALVRDTSSYRGAASAEPYVVTYQARSLMSDLAARLGRVGAMNLDEFRAHMDTLREVFALRARRAQAIAAQMFTGLASARLSIVDRVVRSSAIGLAARNESEAVLASTWIRLINELTTADARDGTGAVEWPLEQNASTAEAMMLAVPSLDLLTSDRAERLHKARLAHRRLVAGASTHDALEASVLLMGMDSSESDRVLREAESVLDRANGLGASLSLPGAILIVRSAAGERLELLGLLEQRLAELGEGEDARQRADAATLLALDGRAIDELVPRVRDLRAYLGRFAPGGMLVPAGLLALMPCELPETLDLLRMVSTALQKERFMAGGAETLVLSTKLLLSTALLAAGAEGDPEERAGWLRFDQLASRRLGFAGVALSMPISLVSMSVFQNPVLSTMEFDRLYQATHSPYVFSTSGSSWGSGSSRGYGWG